VAENLGGIRNLFKAIEDPNKKKYYLLEMFPLSLRARSTWAMFGIIPSEMWWPDING
jgi:hypothetical protein